METARGKLVSVIVPCYNAEAWLIESIESCLQQSYTPLEVIVVDDGSTDGCLEILKSFGSKVRWETGPNRGGNHARNRGFALAKGEYIQYLDADDYLLPEKIERQVGCLEQTGADVVYGDLKYQHHLPDGRILHEDAQLLGLPSPCDDVLEALLAHGTLSPAPYLFCREVIENSDGWDETLRAGQDRDFLISLMIAGAKIVYQQGYYSFYRRYGNVTVSTSNKALLVSSFCKVLKKSKDRLEKLGKLPERYRRAIASSYMSIYKNYGMDLQPECQLKLLIEAVTVSPIAALTSILGLNPLLH